MAKNNKQSNNWEHNCWQLKNSKPKIKNEILENVLINHNEVKVLVVEDNKINMLLSKTLLKRILPNCVIFEANDGNAAINLYKKEKLDLILMDIQILESVRCGTRLS